MKNKQNFLVPLLVVMSLMFIWNLSRNFNDVLIPHLKRACQLTDFQSSLVQSAFFGGYFLLALPVGIFIKKYGYKSGMITGILIASIGAFLFLPAAATLYYTLFLGGLFIMAAGFTFLEVTATPYISILGDEDQASSRLSLAAAVGSIGATIGPTVAAQFLLRAKDVPEETIKKFDPETLKQFLIGEGDLVKIPYLSLATFFIAVGILLFFVKLPKIEEKGENEIKIKEIFKFKHTILGVLAVFCYLGAEVGIVSFVVRYGKSLNIDGLTEQSSAFFITYFMAFVLVGRLSGAYLLRKFDPAKTLAVCAIGAMGMIALSMATSGYMALYSIAFVGAFTSIMYPILFTLSIKNLGPYTKTASSLIIMSFVGGAIIPPIMGAISDALSIKVSFIVPIICYIYIFYFAKKGHIVAQ
jgi:MFS transporter, FHS family, L-fucose permease